MKDLKEAREKAWEDHKPVNTKKIPPFDHFKLLSKVLVDKKTGCWNWLGGKYERYGAFNIYFKGVIHSRRSHRVSYELFNGPIRDGYVIDHLCKNTFCLNPDHLREVTQKINTIENSNSNGAKNKLKTHCPKGHEYTEDNTDWYKGKFRKCTTCRRARDRAISLRERIEKQKEKEGGE